MKRAITTHADPRPRIYITRSAQTTHWSLAPSAVPHTAPSPGAALESALAAVGHVPAVIIYGVFNG